ncbi:MAG: DUF507 family protein [Nitrospira sp.]|nr:DUF507 family protein [Nitrospira sp.]MDD9859776.1 DUF507 family protein [Nitrospira sp.]
MRVLLSEDKQTHLAHLILQAVQRTPEGVLRGDVAQALKEIKRVLADTVSVEARIDQQVRARLASYSRRIPEGSAEWDVLYEKTYQEEMRKRKLG